MVMLILGGLLVVFGGVLDSVFRFRMLRMGQRWALLQGGAFDYSRYHKVRDGTRLGSAASLLSVGRLGLWYRFADCWTFCPFRYESNTHQLGKDLYLLFR